MNEKGSLKHQYFATITANIIYLSLGSMMGWVAPAIATFSSKETPLKDGPLTNAQISWVGSINAIASIVGTFTFGSLTMRLGCKRANHLIAVPAILFWVLVYFGNTYYHILIARFLTGLVAGGVHTTVVLYVAEIANNDVRGRLSSFSAIAKNITICGAYALGILPYKVSCIFIILPITFGILFFFLPNTPQYHLSKGNSKKANESLKFYEGYKTKNSEESIALMAELERMKSIANNPRNNEKTTMKDIFNRKALKGILICVTLSSLDQLTGVYVFLTYPVVIFKQVGTEPILDPHTSSIVVAIIKIAGALSTTKFCDSLGRKALLMFSFVGSALGLFSFALYAHLKKSGYANFPAFDWLPLICVSFVTYVCAAGIIPLLSLCTVELLPRKARTIGLTISTMFYYSSAFSSLKIFPIWNEQIGIEMCMLVFGIFSTVGALFVYFVIEETKGKALDALHSKRNEIVE